MCLIHTSCKLYLGDTLCKTPVPKVVNTGVPIGSAATRRNAEDGAYTRVPVQANEEEKEKEAVLLCEDDQEDALPATDVALSKQTV